MTWRVDDAVASQRLRDARIHVSEVSFRLGTLSPRIRVRLFRRPGYRDIYFEQSHYLVPPDRQTPVSPQVDCDSNEAHAVSLVVDTMTAAYEEAVGRGLEPADDWLMANADY